MNADLQFLVVAFAAFAGSALANAGQWFIARDADGIRDDFSFKKFVSSLGSAAYAAFGIAAAYQITQTFGVKEIMGAVMLGVGAQYASNKLRDI